MYNDFETAFYKPIDIVTVRSVRENWNIRSTRYLYRNIKNDKVVIWLIHSIERFGADYNIFMNDGYYRYRWCSEICFYEEYQFYINKY